MRITHILLGALMLVPFAAPERALCSTITDVANVELLRALTPAGSSIVFTQGYYHPGDGGGGSYYAATGPSAGTYVENGGSVILPKGGTGKDAWLLAQSGEPNALQWGLVGDNATDNYARLNTFLAANAGREVFFPDTAQGYLIGTGTVTIPPGTVLRGQTRWGTQLIHAFNGDMFIMKNQTGLVNLNLVGGRGKYAGIAMHFAGIDGSQIVQGVMATGFQGPIEYFEVGAGSQSATNDVVFYCNSPSGGVGSYSVVIQDVPELTAVPRTFTEFNSGGQPSFSFGGANDLFIGNGGYIGALSYSVNSRSVHISNVRMGGIPVQSELPPLTILGSSHSIVGTDVGPQVLIGPNANAISLSGNQYNVPTIIDNSGNNRNNIDQWTVAYTTVLPIFSSGGTPATLGNGTIVSTYGRAAAQVTVSIEMTAGSTTTFGTGALSWRVPDSIPTPSQNAAVGTAVIVHSGKAYTATVFTSAGFRTLTLYLPTGGEVSYNSPGTLGQKPATFGKNDIFRISATFSL